MSLLDSSQSNRVGGGNRKEVGDLEAAVLEFCTQQGQ